MQILGFLTTPLASPSFKVNFFRPGSENSESLLIESAKFDDISCQLSLKDREVSQLLNDLHAAKQEKDVEVEAIAKKLAEFRTENAELSKKVQNLSLKLECQADYASIKKDLAILKVIYFWTAST